MTDRATKGRSTNDFVDVKEGVVVATGATVVVVVGATVVVVVVGAKVVEVVDVVVGATVVVVVGAIVVDVVDVAVGATVVVVVAGATVVDVVVGATVVVVVVVVVVGATGVTTSLVNETAPSPIMLRAATRKRYSVSLNNPVMVTEVAVDTASSTRVHVVPSSEYSTR